MIRGHLAFHGEFAAALFDQASDLQVLFMDIVVDLILLRAAREQHDRRQQIDAHSRFAASRPHSARHGARQLWPRTRRHEQRVLELGTNVRHAARQLDILEIGGRLGRAVERKRILRLLLGQRRCRPAEIRLRHFSDLKTPGAAHFAHHRAGRVGRRLLGWRHQSQWRVTSLHMLADDRLLHPLFSPALREARPLQRQRTKREHHFLLDGQADRGQTDSRRQQKSDQGGSGEHDRGAAPIQIADGRAIDLLP